MSAKKSYDTTIAQIAGNLLSSTFEMYQLHTLGTGVEPHTVDYRRVVAGAVQIARAIVEEVERTAPKDQDG